MRIIATVIGSVIRHTGDSVRALLLLVTVLLLQGCPPHQLPQASTPATTVMEEVSSDQRPLFTDDMAYDGLAQAIDFSLSYLSRIPADTGFTFGLDRYTAAHLMTSLSHFGKFIETRPSPAALNRFLLENYKLYQSVGENIPQQVLFTGYYEPSLAGSLTETERYRYPVLSRPRDLVTIDLSLFSKDYLGKTLVGRLEGERMVPYFDRDAIEKGALGGTVTPLAWVEDRVSLFFLQIQGSGKIHLNSGGILNVHYHASNGKAYRSIGNLLIEQGEIPRAEMSMQRIRSYLNAHPEEIDDLFSYNPSYVFFKLEPDGPLGCLDVKLTPGRSLAVDRRIFPMATLCFIQTQKPLVDGNSAIVAWTECNRFVLNQDTGGAIRGPARGDLFWGNGPYAELAAGHMQHPGRLFFLVLKPGVS
jgi:membrane-bound lytic murein transglycosylase A